MKLKCAKCGDEMKEGFIADQTFGEKVVSHWVAGKPDVSAWMGTEVREKQQFAVATFRCSRCGYLESYAP
jgi:predicted nucleic-acid-binding Zn-ribbon protein